MDSIDGATMQLPPMAQLARKMANIMGQLKRLKQGGQNSQGWTFTSIDDITDAIRALMAEHGIALFSKMLTANEVKDGKVTRATVNMEFELVCADTGVSKVMQWTGSAEDHSDKAMNKAAVYAEKFWLKSTFLVSTGKDPDATSPRLEKPRVVQQQPQRPPEPAKPAANGRHVDMQTGEVLSSNAEQKPEPRMAICLKTNSDCQYQFSKLCGELGVTNDEPYLKHLGNIKGYSEFPGTFDELCNKMRELFVWFINEGHRVGEDEPAPELDPVEIAAQITVDDTKNLLNTQTGSSTRKPAESAADDYRLPTGGISPLVATSNGDTAAGGATSASPSNDDIPPNPVNPNYRKRPNGAAETMLPGTPAISN